MKKVLLFFPVLLVLIHLACNKMDSTYVDFLKDGPITYSQKVDSARVFSGRKRVLITWAAIRDPRVSKIKIFWDSRAQSKEIPVTSVIDTSVLIDGLTEGNIFFEFYTYDEAGNSSVRTEAAGAVYDTLYDRGLILRDASSVTRSGASVEVSFKSMLGVDAYYSQEITYTSSVSNQSKTIMIPASQSSVTLADFSGSGFTHRSVYLPQLLSPDRFYSPSAYVRVP